VTDWLQTSEKFLRSFFK